MIACFDGANLERANLEGANLERANLEGANLERANLKRTGLRDAADGEAHVTLCDWTVYYQKTE